MRKKYIKYILTAAIALPMAGCNDYLDVVPKGDITSIESTFEKREDAQQWMWTCMSMRDNDLSKLLGGNNVTNANPAYWGCDEVVWDDYTHDEGIGRTKNYIPGIMIAEGNQKTSSPYCEIWAGDKFYAGIRYCNLFFERIGGTYGMEQEEKNFWKAEVQACKAHLYFELIRRYGPIILVPENIDPNASTKDMQRPRSPLDSCFNATVALLDSAIAVLPTQDGLNRDFYAFYSKEGAATLKAMVLLYAASPLFNGNQQFASMTNKNGVRLFPEYDKEKWHRAAIAADEAIEMAKNAGHYLVSGSNDRPTTLLNTMYDLEKASNDYDWSNPEALVMIHDHGNQEGRYYRPKVDQSVRGRSNYRDNNVNGGIAASMKMVEMYYTEHGLPLDEDRQWMPSRYQMSRETDLRYENVVKLNTPVLNLHRRREPRFYANIVAHGTLWYHRMLTSNTRMTAIDCNILQGQLFGSWTKTLTPSQAQNITGYYIKKFDVSNVAFNNYIYNLNNNGDRAIMLWKLSDLLLASSEAWNEYLDAPDDRVYKGIDEVRERAGIPDVVEAWTQYARNPQLCHTQAGMRSIIRQEENIEFAFEGRRFWNLRRWMTAPEELNQAMMGWNITADNETQFFNNGEGPQVVWKKRAFTAPRDYFWPIDASEVQRSGVRQNLGW